MVSIRPGDCVENGLEHDLLPNHHYLDTNQPIVAHSPLSHALMHTPREEGAYYTSLFMLIFPFLFGWS